MKISGYDIREEISRGKNFTICRAVKENDGTQYVLKIVDKKTVHDFDVIRSLRQEFRLLKQVESPYVIKAVEWRDPKDHAVLVLEDINGRSLKDILKFNRFNLEQFLELSLKIATGLAAIHRQNIIHKDINPSNIIWDSGSGSLKIIDFHIALKFDIKVSYLGNPEKLQGTLAYISPEQTGRMNRRVDQRTDLYSLGIVFYELLTGKLPFRSVNPMEIVYHHLARDPEPPHVLEPRLPELVSKIILKLLAKDPEDRYQSVEGLMYDLEKIQKQADSGAEDFRLGEKDFSGKLQVPERLYGREQETRQLLDAYQRVSRGTKEMILVAGYSGTGKTALVNEIHKPITKDRGYFISGKFDQLQRTIPYFAFSQALNQFCQLLLTEDREMLMQWKKRILKAVGNLGKVLTDIVPQLESVIGIQPDVPEVGGDDARKRFNFAFQRFIQAVSTREHPLVLFLDDLQWADLASLHLLQVLMEGSQNRYILFIGAYRDNEVTPTHPLMSTCEELQKQEIAISTIPVKNLSRENIRQWLGDTLKAAVKPDVGDLSVLMYEKTRGNAFFTIQFLQNLYEEELLHFDFKQSRWRWNIDEIEKLNITDNVVDLLVRKIRTLPTPVQEVLRLAACIGNAFDLGTLAVISGLEEEQHQRDLETALAEFLVYPIGSDVYKFVHDRIHQAAYFLIGEKDRIPLHLKIGRLLMKKYELVDAENISKEAEHHLFDIVNHLNTGVQLIESEAEKLQLARLNLRAGRSAKLSAAYTPAADYVKTAIQLLPPDSQKQHYELILALYNEAVQNSYLLGDFEEMETYVEKVMGMAVDISHQTVAYDYQLMALMAQNQPHKAIDTIIEIFKDLGVDIPRTPDMTQTGEILQKTAARLKRKGIGSLVDLPAMADAKKALVSRLFYNGATAFIFAGQEVLPYVVGKITGLVPRYGLAPETPYLFSFYALIQLILGDIANAYRFGEIAREMLDKGVGNDAVRGRAVAVISMYMHGQKNHFKEVCQQMVNDYPFTLNSGDFEYAAYLLTNYIMCLSRTDTELTIISEKAQANRDSVIELKQAILMPPLTIEISYNNALLGKTSLPTSMDIDEDKLFEGMQAGTIQLFTWQINIKNVLLAIFFEDYGNLLAHVEAGEKNGENLNVPMTYVISDTLFYFPLAYLLLCGRTDSEEDKIKYLEKARQTMDTLSAWAKFGPVNFLHKYYLLQAELFRVTGKNGKAESYYEKAIETAYKNDYINEAGLANELAAKFYMRNNRHKLAALYLMEARDCYHRWGARTKVKHLGENYPKYLSMFTPISTSGGGTVSTSSTFASAGALDVKSILNASQTLSGEVQLKPLLEKMMQILIENAGAQKGVLIENAAGTLLVQAEGDTGGVKGVLQNTPVEESEIVPSSLINYVARTRKKLVFENVSSSVNYAKDKYIKVHQTKSAVCFPVLSKGDLSAIIYLENNLVEGAFTETRLEVLNILSTQIAISMENTYLYENLEEKVQQRTLELKNANRELEKNHKALEESHKKINDSVNYASKIQEAVLPSGDILEEFLPRHFIFYRPCSVVSGDFYWVKEIEGKIIVASADCTGHGVPGALLSMLGAAFLNELVPSLAAQSKLQADAVLNRLRNEVKIALKQTDKFTGQKEGMDIGLCIIDPATQSLQYAGAYHSLYLIHDNKLDEIKGDRMPIGVYRKESPFSIHHINYHEGQMLYLSSDGYADQMSEVNNEKFKKKNFRKLLLEINQEPVENQKKILIWRFEEWQGTSPQVDDVLVLGIRL